MNFCAACSMPLEDPTLVGLQQNDEMFCLYCVSEEKKVRSCEEIFEGGVQFFLSLDPTFSRSFAEKNVRKNMKSLPYWQSSTSSCLNGEVASDEEFAQILARLQK